MNLPTRSLLSFALLFGSALAALARVDRVVEKTFPVKGAGVLHVETQGGEIRVTPSNDGMVRVTAKERIRADSGAEADEVLKKLSLTFEQTGNDVRVISKYESKPFNFRGNWPPVQVDVIVSLPAEYATELHTSGGGITVGDLRGKAELRTSGGSITLGRMGGRVDARTSGGNIQLAEAGSAVELKTSGGNISVGQVNGPADLSTSGGSIKVDAVANSLRAHTSGGSIRARINGALKEECSLSTSGGHVHVSVDKTANFRLDAATSGGGVDVDGLTLAVEKVTRERSRLAASVNGGGPLLKLRTSGGSIAVRAN